MANNIVGGAPNAIVAKSTVDFVTAGITALNTAIIFEVGNPLKSYVPGRSINAISGFIANKGYYLVALQDIDLTASVAPPLTGIGDTTAPTIVSKNTTDATHISVVFSEVVTTSAVAGFSFRKNGSALAASAVSGSGTNTLVFTVSTMASGDTLDISYNPGSGDCMDAASNELATVTNSTVTNNISSGTGALITFGTVTNLEETPTGNWNPDSTPTGAGAFGNTGLSAKKLAAGTTGRIYTDAGSHGAVLGFNTANAQTGFAGMEAAVVITTDVFAVDGGTLGASIETKVSGDKYAVQRNGSTGVVKIQRSADGVSWTDIATLSFTSTADLFIVADVQAGDGGAIPVDGELINPKGDNIA